MTLAATTKSTRFPIEYTITLSLVNRTSVVAVVDRVFGLERIGAATDETIVIRRAVAVRQTQHAGRADRGGNPRQLIPCIEASRFKQAGAQRPVGDLAGALERRSPCSR